MFSIIKDEDEDEDEHWLENDYEKAHIWSSSAAVADCVRGWLSHHPTFTYTHILTLNPHSQVVEEFSSVRVGSVLEKLHVARGQSMSMELRLLLIVPRHQIQSNFFSFLNANTSSHLSLNGSETFKMVMGGRISHSFKDTNQPFQGSKREGRTKPGKRVKTAEKRFINTVGGMGRDRWTEIRGKKKRNLSP